MSDTIGNMSYIGYAECDDCHKFVYYSDPANIYIWDHPNDKTIAEVVCPLCGLKIVSQISADHRENFRRRGCVINHINDKFPPLTEKDIDEWDIDAGLLEHF